MTGYFEQFAASVGSIVVSEIGDKVAKKNLLFSEFMLYFKTFFIAAIMAMRYDRTYSFIGAISALIIMTILSCAFG
jgi:putative Ca2+/H+ antiporter (TMEM165/GDT1 family)